MGAHMKKLSWRLSFPFFFASFCLLFYQFLYRPHWPSLEMVVALLLFLTGLAWSALIYLSMERGHWLRYLYSALAALLSIFLVEGLRPFPEGLSMQRLVYGCNLLGMAIIESYLRIYRRRQN
jgi:hypothetical protein